MRLANVPVNKEVVSLATGDFNGDGKFDIAFYGTPAELTVLLNQGDGRFDGGAVKVNTGEAIESATRSPSATSTATAKTTSAVSSGELILVYQGKKGTLGTPERVPHTAANPRILRAVDLDGDGGDDLVIMDGGNDDPLRVRFRPKAASLDPSSGSRRKRHARWRLERSTTARVRRY